MKILLTIILVSIIIIALVFLLNAASFDGVGRNLENKPEKTIKKLK